MLTITALARAVSHRRVVTVLAALLGAVAFGAFAAPAFAEDPLLSGVSCPNQSDQNTAWGPAYPAGNGQYVDQRRAAVACLVNAVRANYAVRGDAAHPGAHPDVKQLKYCYVTPAGVYSCNFTSVPGSAVLTTTNAQAFALAAQWKAMDADYGINTSAFSTSRGVVRAFQCENNGNGVVEPNPYSFDYPDPFYQGYIDYSYRMAYIWGNAHYACGRDIEWWDRFTGVTTSIGSGQNYLGISENLYWATPGSYLATPRAAVDWWLNSPGHRVNMLDPSVTMLGVGASPAANGWIGARPTPCTPAPPPGQLCPATLLYRQFFSTQFLK